MRERVRHHVADAPARVTDLPSWLITRVHGRVGELLSEGFRDHGSGLRSYHYRLLATVEERGPLSQADLGRHIAMDRSDVTAALVDLEAKGLVARAPDPRHGRRKLVSITAEGAQLLAELDDVVAEVQRRLLEPLSGEEQQSFVAMLRTVAEA